MSVHVGTVQKSGLLGLLGRCSGLTNTGEISCGESLFVSAWFALVVNSIAEMPGSICERALRHGPMKVPLVS